MQPRRGTAHHPITHGCLCHEPRLWEALNEAPSKIVHSHTAPPPSPSLSPPPPLFSWHQVKRIAYYSPQDVSLGQFLLGSCFNPHLRCHNPKCQRTMLDHLMSFSHRGNQVFLNRETECT